MKTLQDLLTLCLELNSPTFHVWFDYSGHVDAVTIRCIKGGYTEGANHDLSEWIYLDGSFIEVNKQIVDTYNRLIELHAESGNSHD